MSDNPFSLQGKTIMVTGASSGIGRTCAIEIARAGASRVIITGRDKERLRDTSNEIGVMSETTLIVADLTDKDSVEKLIADIPEIDGLVLSAGINRQKTLSFIKDSDLSDIFGINCFADTRLLGLILKKKKLKRHSSVVLIASISGHSNFAVGNAAYGASKQAAVAFMKYAAVELGPKGIRCNVIHPGRVETPLIANGLMTDEDLDRDRKNYPLKRYGQPEEIAYGAVYLLSDASSWVTGSELVIDGGRSLV